MGKTYLLRKSGLSLCPEGFRLLEFFLNTCSIYSIYAFSHCLAFLFTQLKKGICNTGLMLESRTGVCKLFQSKLREQRLPAPQAMWSLSQWLSSAVVAQSSQGQYVWNGRGCVPNKTPLTEIDSWPYSAHEPQFTNRWSRAKNTGYRQGQVRTYSVSIISLPQIPYSTFIIWGIIIPSLLSIKWKTGRELIKTNFLHPIAILSVRHFPQFFIHTIISDKWLFLNIISPSSCSYSARLIERHHPLIP